MIKVYEAETMTEANRILELLAGSGISAEVHGEPYWGDQTDAIPAVHPPIKPTVWVEPRDVEAAHQILGAENSPNAKKLKNWKCSHCGETSEGTFLTCWNCGTTRATEKSTSPSDAMPVT